MQVKDLTERFPSVTPLALVLKQFLADRSLDQSYSGGLSSYCLVSSCFIHVVLEEHMQLCPSLICSWPPLSLISYHSLAFVILDRPVSILKLNLKLIHFPFYRVTKY